MKKTIVLLVFIVLSVSASAQKIAVKNNLIADATTSLNLGVEFKLAKQMSIDTYFSHSPFVFDGNKKFLHTFGMAELRYWSCVPFNGFFVGLHAFGGQYNVAKIPIAANVKNYRYQGDLFGGGLTLGYQWVLTARWNLEASLGAGFAKILYTQHDLEVDPLNVIGSGSEIYKGLTRASLSLIFFFN